MPGGGHLKMNQGGRLYDYMKQGGRLKMVRNDEGDLVPFYAADGKGRMEYGGKTMGHGGMNDGEPMLVIKVGEEGMKYMDEGGKGLFKRKEEEKTSDPGDREKGTIYYDDSSQGFFEVMPNGDARLLTARDGEKVYSYLKEQVGGEGLGLPASVESEEMMEKYPVLYGFKVGRQTGEPILDSEGKKMSGGADTYSGNINAVKNAIRAALGKGDPALMSMILNPYEDSTSKVFDNIQPYGIERVENVSDTSTTKRGIDFQSLDIAEVGTYPSGATAHGQKVYGPSKIERKKVVAEGGEKPGETLITPEGETIQVNPDAVQTPGFGEGSPSTNPDVIREGAVPYQGKMNFGGRLRMANQGAKMAEQARRTVFRFPRS